MTREPSPPSATAARLVPVLCAAELASMVGTFGFPALLPDFREAWALTHTEAGWISGVYFGGYTLAVPVLASLTDRVDARRVYLLGAATATLAHLGFALFASGFWSALLLRALWDRRKWGYVAGLSLAGVSAGAVPASSSAAYRRLRAAMTRAWLATRSGGRFSRNLPRSTSKRAAADSRSAISFSSASESAGAQGDSAPPKTNSSGAPRPSAWALTWRIQALTPSA